MTPQRTQTSKFVIPRVSKGFAFGSDDISKIASGEDPMAAMWAYIANNLQTFRTRHLMALLDAAFNTGGPLAAQTWDAAAPAGATPTAAESISITQVVAALNLLGERSSRITSIACHSSVYHWLMHQGMLQFSSPAGVGTGSAIQWGGGGIGVQSPGFEYFAGLRVVVDDMIKPVPGGTAGNPKSTRFIRSATGYSRKASRRSSAWSLIATSSKQDVASCHYMWAIGIPGISWVGTPAQIAQGSFNATNPTLPAQAWSPTYAHLTDLATPSNWTLAWSNREYIPAIRMTTFSPFGGVYHPLSL